MSSECFWGLVKFRLRTTENSTVCRMVRQSYVMLVIGWFSALDLSEEDQTPNYVRFVRKWDKKKISISSSHNVFFGARLTGDRMC